MGFDCYIGIDPGKSGAIAALKHDGSILLLENCPVIKITKTKEMSDPREMNNLFWEFIHKLDGNVIIIIEKGRSMPKQGVASTFKFGRNVGQWEGIIYGTKFPIEERSAKTWQKVMLEDMDRSDTKLASVAKANMLWPGLNLKKTHHGKSDALLIAEYGRRKF